MPASKNISFCNQKTKRNRYTKITTLTFLSAFFFFFVSLQSSIPHLLLLLLLIKMGPVQSGRLRFSTGKSKGRRNKAAGTIPLRFVWTPAIRLNATKIHARATVQTPKSCRHKFDRAALCGLFHPTTLSSSFLFLPSSGIETGGEIPTQPARQRQLSYAPVVQSALGTK